MTPQAHTNLIVHKVWCDETLVWAEKRVLSTSDPTLRYFIAGPYLLKAASRKWSTVV